MKKCFQPAYALAILSVIICISVIPLNAQADVITVCPAGCNFTKIQDAINYAADGDSIQVMSGSYNEVIEINKSVNLSGIASSGEYPHIGRYTMPVAVTVSAPGVTFEGFDIHGEGEHAIELKASHVTVRNVTVGIHRPGYEGDAVIEGIGISDITIADCMMQSTGGYGIYFQDCLDLVVERNEIIVNNQTTEVSQRAIASIYSPLDADYSGVRIEHNAVTGGTIESSVIWQEEAEFTPFIHDILIRNNSVTNSNGPAITVNAPPDYSGTGVIMYHLSDIAVLDNNVFDSEKGTGIGVWGAMDSLISGNEVKNLKDYSSGIDLSDSTRINVSHNTISDCTGEDATGLSLYDVTASTVSGNQLDRNTYNFLFESAENFTPMMDIDSTNLADGRPIRYYEGMDNFSVDGNEANGAAYYFISCRNFTAARLAPSHMYEGITYLNCQNGSLTHSNVEYCTRGIWLIGSSDCFVFTNRLSDNMVGIFITRCNNSMVWRNDVYNSITSGVTMTGLNHDLKVSNNIIKNNNNGIVVASNPLVAYDAILDGNEIIGNSLGLWVSGTKGLTVTNNVIGDSAGPGILLAYSRDAMFSQNRVRNNSVGMKIVTRPWGSSVPGNNTFVDNYFNNFNQVILSPPEGPKGDLFMDKMKVSSASDEIMEAVGAIEEVSTSEVNYWNVTKTAGTNIVGGPYLGGNYWASPDGTGFSQTHPDRGDGFCTVAYVFDKWNADYLPLHTFTPKPTFQADFTVSPVSGTAPLTVKCTDKSVGNPTTLVYDFGDGTNVTGPNLTHTYRFPGVYSITLTIMKYNTTTYSVMSSTATKPNAITVTSVPMVPLVAKFAASPVNGTAPLKVSFTDQSTGNPTFRNYDFGDGINATGPNAVHTYRFPGVYNVTLSIFRFDSTTGLMLGNVSVQKDLIVVNG